ncbi:MAG: WecB/TagA/CpsF family glycosyltransferase [Sulfitobacter sp.]|nr:WecB/TagA/CpsF family glycosyltransferase [Sulfitobacter sp.]
MKFGKTGSEVEVNVPTRAALFRQVAGCLEARRGFAVATLNLDHLTKLPLDPEFLEAYRAQDLVVADGRPVVWLAALAGEGLELMPGSDLILPLAALCAERDVPVALVGSSDEALEGAARTLVAHVPGLKISYRHAPPYGFDPVGEAADAILEEVAASGAGLCFLALGAPKQERLAARGRKKAPSVGFASIGAGLDFLSGHQMRAPRILRILALEWLWRALSSPRRLIPRYARCFAILPRLTLDALRQRR